MVSIFIYMFPENYIHINEEEKLGEDENHLKAKKGNVLTEAAASLPRELWRRRGCISIVILVCVHIDRISFEVGLRNTSWGAHPQSQPPRRPWWEDLLNL